MTVPAEFVLEDQFGRPHWVRFADEPLTLLVFTGRATVADGVAWTRLVPEALARAGAPDARVVAVAAVGRVPGFARGVVKMALAGQPPVPIDWDDAVAGQFNYRPGVARAVLVDDLGRVRAAADGAPTEALLAGFAEAARPRAGPRVAPRRRGGADDR